MKQIEDIGKTIGVFLNKIEMPEVAKQLIAELAPQLDEEQLRFLVEKLEDMYATQLLVESDEEYQKEVQKIDEEAGEEIKKLLNEQK